MNQQEQWRPVAGFPDYEVSNTGRVISHRAWRGHPGPRQLRGSSATGHGYRVVYLTPADGGPVRRFVHHLVAEAFHGARPAGLIIRHLDGNPFNNTAENLRYGTAAENEADKVAHGTHPHAAKTHCPQGHAYDADNTYRRPSNPSVRECRACQRGRDRSDKRSIRAARMQAAA